MLDASISDHVPHTAAIFDWFGGVGVGEGAGVAVGVGVDVGFGVGVGVAVPVGVGVALGDGPDGCVRSHLQYAVLWFATDFAQYARPLLRLCDCCVADTSVVVLGSDAVESDTTAIAAMPVTVARMTAPIDRRACRCMEGHLLKTLDAADY